MPLISVSSEKHCSTRNMLRASVGQLWIISILTTEILATKSALTSPLGPVVDLGYVAYAGNSTSPAGQANSSVTFFGGISYAQPPLGELRFRAPSELNEWFNPNRAIVDARSWGNICVQQPAAEGRGVEGK